MEDRQNGRQNTLVRHGRSASWGKGPERLAPIVERDLESRERR